MAKHCLHPSTAMVAPTAPAVPTSLQSRRPPAHRSVSLLQSPRKRLLPTKAQKSDSSSDNAGANRSGTDSDSRSSMLALGRDSSGESSNAETWFDKSNNAVHTNTASFANNDPPFFMRHESSSETPPDAHTQQQHLQGRNSGSNSLPQHTGLIHLGTDGGSTEDYRGVIDDLTIENRKLKRRLKRYEQVHDSHLRDEKLFEVRVHGLPPDKKRELEETLRKFTAGLRPGYPSNAFDRLAPMLDKKHAGSSHTSFNNADSAYASMSASGQGSSAQSGAETRYKRAGPIPALRDHNTHSNIHSYLHHIPEGLLPQTNPANMTERQKKKLVVRRLEQIFAGKGAALNGHQHSLQQQDVSHMAARADTASSEAQDQRARQEGSREAHIMSGTVEDPADPVDSRQHEDSASQARSERLAAAAVPRSETQTNNDQRPTRPLDLDPHRAQVPEDNIRYFRHLGFSPPDLDSRSSPVEGHGWIYLNLLINMAQLHTINVTDDFVRKAMNEFSSKFEQSPDGRKVRWRGGRSVTRTSSGGGGSSRRAEFDASEQASPRKRPKLSHRESTFNVQSGAASGRRSQHDKKLIYTPLFFHRDSTDETESISDEDDDESMSGPFPAPVAGDSSGMQSSAMRTNTTKKLKKRDDGPIIFYNNARFCTDLSGDRNSMGNPNAPPYAIATEEPLGKSQKKLSWMAYEKRGRLASTSMLPEPMDLGDNPIPASLELVFPPRSPVAKNEVPSVEPLEMEVTGIGGVWPADNFAISVISRHARIDPEEAKASNRAMPAQRIPDRFASIVKDAHRQPELGVRKQILSTKTQVLPPSNLPEALSFMPFSDDSQDGDESEMGDMVSMTPESPGALPPSAAPQPVELHYISSDEEEDDDYDDDDDDDESDGSLDLLAAAREVDPEAIRAREREYDANMAERLAEEIPAGSSAATAGGGSGFTSPVTGVKRGSEAIRAARAIRNAQVIRSVQQTSSPDQQEVDSNASIRAVGSQG